MSNTIGYHTPLLTAFTLNAVNNLQLLQFEDSSYSNDESDSIYNESHDVTIYIPSKEYPTYLIKSDNEQIKEVETDNILTLVETIKTIYQS